MRHETFSGGVGSPQFEDDNFADYTLRHIPGARSSEDRVSEAHPVSVRNRRGLYRLSTEEKNKHLLQIKGKEKRELVRAESILECENNPD